MRPNSYLLSSSGNKVIIKDLAKMFDLSTHYIWKLISAHNLTKVAELTSLRKGKIKRVRQDDIVVQDSNGDDYSIGDICTMLNRSRTWATRAYNKFDCVNLQDFIDRDKVATRFGKKAAPPKDIDDIPMGSWEMKHYRCPPASKVKGSAEIFKKIKIEEAGRTLAA